MPSPEIFRPTVHPSDPMSIHPIHSPKRTGQWPTSAASLATCACRALLGCLGLTALLIGGWEDAGAQVISENYSIGSSAGDTKVDAGRADWQYYSNLQGITISAPPLIYLNDARTSLRGSSNYAQVAYLSPPGNPLSQFTAQGFAPFFSVSPFGSWDGRRFSYPFTNAVIYLPTSYLSLVNHSYFAIPKVFDLEVTDNWEGTSGAKVNERVSLSGNPPVLTQSRGRSGVVYLNTNHTPTLNAEAFNAVTAATRYVAEPAGWTFISNPARNNRVFRSRGNTATLSPTQIRDERNATLEWNWNKFLYRRIKVATKLAWTLPDSQPTPIGALDTFGQDEFVNPTTTAFDRPPILYLNENLTQVVPGESVAAAWVARPSGYSYEFRNANGDPTLVNPDATLMDATNKATINLAKRLKVGQESQQHLEGEVTWFFDLERPPAKEYNVTVASAYTVGSPFAGVKYGEFSGPLENRTYPGVEENTPVTFRAPPEIYLNENGGNPQPDFFEGARYRAVLIGHSVNGTAFNGGENLFELTVTADTSVSWEWRLEYAVRIRSEVGSGGNPVPAVETHFYPRNSTVTFSVDASTQEGPGANARASVKEYRITRPAFGAGEQEEETFQPAAGEVAELSGRVTSEEYTITDWMDVDWIWEGEVKYTFDATIGGATAALLDGQAFVEFYAEDGVTVEKTEVSSGSLGELWIPTGRKATVGAYYRTRDRCFTLVDFAGVPGGDLSELGTDISVLEDSMDAENRVVRSVTVEDVRSPTQVNWIYQPTVFRAEIPLGESFDPTSPDTYLVPNLCEGAVLSMEGPSEVFLLPVGEQVDGPTAPLLWDKVGRQLFPVRPGSNQIEWPDQDIPGRSYRIEVVSTYPGEHAPLASERELADGRRQTVSVENQRPVLDENGDPQEDPNGDPVFESFLVEEYVTETPPLAETTGFPASPGAHYRHLYDSKLGRRPPTSLDLDSNDEWAFQELTYSDQGTNASAPNKTFEATGAGRSVLLFSYRPNSDEIADGNLEMERLAVRVIESSAIDPVRPTDERLVLGQRGLALGQGRAPGADGAYGILQRDGVSVTSIDPGENFVVDFWLNAKGIRSTDEPVTVLTTGEGKLVVTLDPGNSTVTTDYLGLRAVHPFTTAGASWKHHVIHVFTNALLGFDATVVDYYLDGVQQEQASVGELPTAPPASSTVGVDLPATSLRFGVNANPRSRLQLDQFRLFTLPADPDPWLTPGELRKLRTVRDMNTDEDDHLRGTAPALWFSFEDRYTISPDSFRNQGTLPDVGLGFVSDQSWARVALQEVATRLESTLDNAGFGGSGYVLNANSNYNADLYDREAEVGAWGPVFPVNRSQLFVNALEVAYYENPYLSKPLAHPNVAWPYVAAEYSDVEFPSFGPHKDKAIYIASRVGSEGVDQTGRPQQVYDLADYSDLEIYNQPSRDLPGFNPNEEHALVAASNRAALRIKTLGQDIPNNPPLAAYALQDGINAISSSYTSDPWVLVQFKNLRTGEPEMAAYEVFTTRDLPTPAGVEDLRFPRPTDSAVTATDGLAYESAQAPEDRFLTIDPEGTYNFKYLFEYPAFAGDLLIPPYPLNLVIGNASMADARGGQVPVNGRDQRTLWRDVNRNAWIVSGDGAFFYQYFYPFRGDFFYPAEAAVGDPVAWLPTDGNFIGDNIAAIPADDSPKPVQVTYKTGWRTSYPKLKRGETLTYQGGEYFNENPGSNGLPALVAMAATEVVYDSATPGMVISDANVDDYSARIIRPLDRREKPFSVGQMDDAKFNPAAQDKIFVVAERWYFKELPGSLQKRFYFDSLAEKLVFRGYLNDKDSGDPDLTSGPDPINVLEPNVMTADEYRLVEDLAGTTDWIEAVSSIFRQSQNPDPVRRLNSSGSVDPFYDPAGKYLAGVRELPEVKLKFSILTEDQRKGEELRNEIGKEIDARWVKEDAFGLLAKYLPVPLPESSRPRFIHLDSFGAGSALVPNPKLLTDPVTGSSYITIAENNRVELNGAPVSLHIIEIVPDRYRGAIKVIEGADAFSEKITLQHNGDFGANTGDLYYEWWIRDAAPLDVVAEEVLDDGTLEEVDLATGQSLWQQYLPKARAENANLTEIEKHLGLHTVVFEGRPDVTLADKLVLVRYRHKDESGWNLVPFEITEPAAEWQPGVVLSDDDPPTATVTGPAPFQWAGAANSPQLQADGSKRYIPQLVMGWVKRVLDRINPYEARYTDFFGNESPAVYSSQIQIAGAPFAGKVALNPDKNVIENTGLIELYETVLARARELSIDNSSNPVSTDAINQALLLAATRLSVLYELLAREAYSDAQDSTITVTDVDDLSSVASFTHAFQNLEPDLLHEELSLLRGTDFRKSYPVNNRMFWNYAKGLGEAAYNVNYGIYDENTDGFINEDDARALYPQGHGDAWGHFVSALGMHYTLLQQPVFSWKTRSELYSLMQNVLEVDYLDEKTFAKLAAGKARAGRDIVRNTYRLHYTQDPDGQWQGYTDGADPARAWGVSEWATRSGQAAYFDWAVANALLPEEASAATPVENPENLDRIERLGAIDEIGEIAGGFYEIQTAIDDANGGANPLGFDSDAIAFDIDPYFDGQGWERQTHFEQIYARAVEAGNNALATLDFAAQVGNKLQRIAGDTDAMIVEALRQDIDYRNRLIEIFGRPYDGTIGFGKLYPEGYEGPDTQLFSYLDRNAITDLVQIPEGAGVSTMRFVRTVREAGNLSDDENIADLYAEVYGSFFENISVGIGTIFGTGNPLGVGTEELTNAFEVLAEQRSSLSSASEEVEVPVHRQSPYAFQAPDNWGQRTSYGEIQRVLEEELRERIALDSAIAEYAAFLRDLDAVTNQIKGAAELSGAREDIRLQIALLENQFKILRVTGQKLIDIAEFAGFISKESAEAAATVLPTSAGFSVDVGAPGRGAVKVSQLTATTGANAANKTARAVYNFVEDLAAVIIGDLEEDIEKADEIENLEGLLVNLVGIIGREAPLRNAIGTHTQSLEILRQEFFSAQAEGFRLLREREAFNKVLAAKSQKNRYQDMVLRLTRNEAMSKYQSTFDHAARYAWLAAKAYDYETALDPGNPAAPGQLFDRIVKERQLGLWSDGDPRSGQGGLGEILHQLNGNYSVLKGQLGLNNPQWQNEKISLRSELFRIGAGNAASDDRWEDALKARIVPDLNALPEFRRSCRPLAGDSGALQPGVVIRFPTSIEPGRNVFGLPLAPGDHSYSTANFATKIRGFGVWLENYNAAGLSTTPRAYLVPVGNDYMRMSSSAEPITRMWNVQEQRIPTPYVINEANLKTPGFIPTLNGVDGGFAELRRHGDFRMYHDEGGAVDEDELILDSRLISRSVWNSEWLLIIPGAGLHLDPDTGLTELAETISDIKLHFRTYSLQGQ